MRVEERLGGRAESLSDARHPRQNGAFAPFSSTKAVSLGSRLILVGNIGSGCLNLLSGIGLWDFHRIPMFGATGKNGFHFAVSFYPS